MSNKKIEFFHGVVLCRIIHHLQSSHTIRCFNLKNKSAYILNEKIGLYIKYCQNRITPWIFNFKKSHQDEILEIKNAFNNTFIALVCDYDGIACLKFSELKTILDNDHQDEWLRVDRFKREKYSISGSDGKLKYKIGKNLFPNTILNCLRGAS